MLEQYSRYVILLILAEYIYQGEGHFQNGGCLKTQFMRSEVAPFS